MEDDTEDDDDEDDDDDDENKYKDIKNQDQGWQRYQGW